MITFLVAKKIFRVNTHGVTAPEKSCYGFIGPVMRAMGFTSFLRPAAALRRAEYQCRLYEVGPLGEWA